MGGKRLAKMGKRRRPIYTNTLSAQRSCNLDTVTSQGKMVLVREKWFWSGKNQGKVREFWFLIFVGTLPFVPGLVYSTCDCFSTEYYCLRQHNNKSLCPYTLAKQLHFSTYKGISLQLSMGQCQNHKSPIHQDLLQCMFLQS